jgi:hypothetical protein
MRKTLAALVMMALLLIALPIAADAQSRCRRGRRYATRSYSSQRNYAPRRVYYTQRQRPSFYRRHRNLINLGIASGAGALIGGLAGGRRGALIGLGTGAGAGALYTYVLRPKKRRY